MPSQQASPIHLSPIQQEFLQNTVDPPICNLFEASLPYRFILTFPLIPFLAK